MQSDGGEADEGHYFFFSAPASPVHYILRSPPSSTAPTAAAPDADCCGAGGAGDFEFFSARAGGMSSAEELFVAGRIRVGGGLSPVHQEEAGKEDQDGGGGDDDGVDGDARSPQTRRARSASPPRSPRTATGAEPSTHFFASASSSSSSTSSSSSSAKNTRRRISLRDLLTGTGSGGDAGTGQGPADTAGGAGISRSGFWPPSIWPSRSRKALLPCPAPLPARRPTSSSDSRAAAPAKKLPGGSSPRRTTSLPYRQGLVLGCLGFGARSYGLAKSMHPLYSR